MAQINVNPKLNFRPFAAARELLSSYEQRSPAALAIAEQAIGGVLIIDGIFGSANPFTAGRKNGVWGNFVTLIVGILLLTVLSPFLFNSSFSYANYSKSAQGTVTFTERNVVTYRDSNNHNQTRVECNIGASYVVDGQRYEGSAGSGDNCNYAKGAPVTVRYNAANPSKWATQETVNGAAFGKKATAAFAWLFILVSAWGLVLKSAAVVFGVVLLVRGRRLAGANPDASVDGAAIKAEIQEFFQRRLWGFNG